MSNYILIPPENTGILQLIPEGEEILASCIIELGNIQGKLTLKWEVPFLATKSGCALVFIRQRLEYPFFLPWNEISLKKGMGGAWMTISVPKELKKQHKKVFKGKFRFTLALRHGSDKDAKVFKAFIYDLYQASLGKL